MALVLPFAITDGTVPEADEVQGNFDYLLNQQKGIFGVGKTSSTNTAILRSVTTANTVLSGTSQTFSVATSSMLIMGYSGRVAYTNDGLGSCTGTLAILLDGSPTFGVSTFTDDGQDAGRKIFARVESLGGVQVVALSAGSHTIALQYSLTIASAAFGLQGDGIQGQGAYWSGIVVPVVP